MCSHCPLATAGNHLLLLHTHTFTFSRSGSPPPFSLHSPAFAELQPYRGICVGVDEGSFCPVQGHLHQRKRVGQGLPVSHSPSWNNNNCSCPSSPTASCFARDQSPVEHNAAVIDWGELLFYQMCDHAASDQYHLFKGPILQKVRFPAVYGCMLMPVWANQSEQTGLLGMGALKRLFNRVIRQRVNRCVAAVDSMRKIMQTFSSRHWN